MNDLGPNFSRACVRVQSQSLADHKIFGEKKRKSISEIQNFDLESSISTGILFKQMILERTFCVLNQSENQGDVTSETGYAFLQSAF